MYLWFYNCIYIYDLTTVFLTAVNTFRSSEFRDSNSSASKNKGKTNQSRKRSASASAALPNCSVCKSTRQASQSIAGKRISTESVKEKQTSPSVSVIETSRQSRTRQRSESSVLSGKDSTTSIGSQDSSVSRSKRTTSTSSRQHLVETKSSALSFGICGRRNSLDSTGSEKKVSFKKRSRSESKQVSDLYQISQNLRSNSNASIVEGIPYGRSKTSVKDLKEKALADPFVKLKKETKGKRKSKKRQETSASSTSVTSGSLSDLPSTSTEPRKYQKRVQSSLKKAKVSETKDFQPPLKKSRRRSPCTATAKDKVGEDKSLHNLSADVPKLDSLRRTTKGKKTGSCASSR